MRKEVVIVEDDREEIERYRYVINGEPELKCSHFFQTAEAYLKFLKILPEPHLLLLDLSMPGMGGEKCLEKLSSLNKKNLILVITVLTQPENLFRCLKAGAHGYLTKIVSNSDLLKSVKSILNGEITFSPSIAWMISKYFTDLSKMETNLAKLSDKENFVLKNLSQGKTNQEISNELKLSVKSVEKYVQKILEKLHVGNRAEAAYLYGRVIPNI